MEQLLTYVAGILAVTIIGFVKKVSGPIDIKIASIIKPLQPVIALLLTAGLPWLTNLLHLTAIPDAALLTNAPIATVVAIVCAELYAKLNPPKPVV